MSQLFRILSKFVFLWNFGKLLKNLHSRRRLLHWPEWVLPSPHGLPEVLPMCPWNSVRVHLSRGDSLEHSDQRLWLGGQQQYSQTLGQQCVRIQCWCSYISPLFISKYISKLSGKHVEERNVNWLTLARLKWYVLLDCTVQSLVILSNNVVSQSILYICFPNQR